MTEVRVMVSTAESDSTPLLLSATAEVAFDTLRFKYRSSTGADVSDFNAEWFTTCREQVDEVSSCISNIPYRVSQTAVYPVGAKPRVRTDVYTSPGYNPEYGTAGMTLAGDTVAIALHVFELLLDEETTGFFTIIPRSATVSLYTGRDERGGIGEYVDCGQTGPRCVLRVSD